MIQAYLKKLYKEAYFKNPSYMVRRFWFMIENHEIFWTVYYTIKGGARELNLRRQAPTVRPSPGAGERRSLPRCG